MARTNIEIGFPRSFDLFEEYRDNYSRWTAATFQMISKPEAAGILEGTVFEIFGSPVLPDVLDRLIIEFLFQKDAPMEFGFYECEILLRHYEAGSRGQNNPDAWTEIEMFKAIRKSSVEEWEARAVPAAPLKKGIQAWPFGTEEGEICDREGCRGIIEWVKDDPERSCTCFQGNPPCSVCMDKYLGCPVCDWDSREIEERPDQVAPQPERLNPAEAVLAFVAWLTIRPEPIVMSAAHLAPPALEAAVFFNMIQGFEPARNVWPDIMVPMQGHDRALPFAAKAPDYCSLFVGPNCISAECGELDIHSRIDRIEIGPEGAESIDRRGNRAKVEVCGLEVGSTSWDPKPSRWQRLKAWWIRFLAPLGGWGEQVSDQ